MYSIILICILSILTVLFLIFTNNFNPFEGDGIVYYTYLPSIFIYNDLDLNFLPNFLDYSLIEHFCIYKYLKYSYGCSFLQLPFFLIAHLIALVTNKSMATGYSFIYQLFMQISAIFYFIFALILNYKILKKYVSLNVAQLSLFAITFGTALFYYCSVEATMSHIYSYFVITLFIYFLTKFNSVPFNYKHYFILGLILGLATVVRNNNVLLIILFIFYGVNNISDFKNKIFNFFKPLNILLFFIGFLLFFGPQMLYWYDRTGNLLIFSYRPEFYIKDYPFKHDYDFFNFYKPLIFETLFSIKKGLFVYYPVLLFSLLGLNRYSKLFSYFRYALPIFLLVILYMYSCFDGWHAGGSYGNRFYLDYMALFSILIASYFQHLSNTYSKKIYYFNIFILVLFILFALCLNYLFFLGYSDEYGSFEALFFDWFDSFRIIFNK